ncbi:hypothetical protein RRG08_016332 [Elysia crispata]|uniref:Uncharacterized protein n=1 Tax=Elysia crispata TaxID=231223 RepID=A0AAE1E0R3_9GAST|nr:hypothetical protein RRG08_016332 [Elysia crispata]
MGCDRQHKIPRYMIDACKTIGSVMIPEIGIFGQCSTVYDPCGQDTGPSCYIRTSEIVNFLLEAGQTQTDRKGLGSSTAKWWSKAEGKEKRDMVINEIRLNEDTRRVQKAGQQSQQGQWTNWDNALQKSLTWNEIWHMSPLRISFLIRSVYDLLTLNKSGTMGKERGPHLPRQADHRACLELLQNRPLTGAIHMEA